MNTPSNAMPESRDPQVNGSQINDSQRIAPAALPATRPLYWSIRRELWEYRSIYIAPLAVAALFLIGFLISTAHLPAKIRAASALDPMRQNEIIEQPYDFAAMLLMATYLIVAVFYCLDALHGERRDRSILFWKSLPVSDFTTVLSKASIPFVVLPLITFAITVVTQFVMLLLSTLVLAGSGGGVATLWANVPLFPMSLMLLYHLMAMHGLYYAPFYGWLLMVLAWARRAAFLWAGLPLLAISVVEKIAFNSWHFAGMLGNRVAGGPDAITYPAQTSAMQHMPLVTLGEFLIDPGMWIGLVLFAAFFAAAVRLRRNQGPI